MSKAASLVDELSSLFDELDDTTLDTMDEEKVVEMRKKMYPYGRTIEGSDKVLTFCVTDLDKRFKQRLLMTSMVGFLNRKLDEWHVPDGIPVTSVYDYAKAQSKGEDLLAPTEEELKKETAKYRKERLENEEWMRKRLIVKEFLEDMFQFNPDEHVRSAYKPNFQDTSREVVDTPAGKLAIRHRCRRDTSFKDVMRQWKMKKSLVTASPATAASPATTSTAASPATTSRDVDPSVSKTVREMIPPSDTFHFWNYYLESNYDALLSAVADLYAEVPDFDLSINPLSWHEDVSSADDFIHKHRNEVITEIFKAHSGKWNFYAPYKKIRETTRYFNDKTIVLEEMMKQLESDQRMGEELMKNKIRKKKRKNIEEEGPDDPQFLKWKKENTTLKDMGASEVNQSSYADDECPDDAVQVDVFRISQGGRKLEKSKFYTKAEAPEFPSESKEKDARAMALQAAEKKQ